MSTTPLKQSFQLFEDVTESVLTNYKNGLTHNFDDEIKNHGFNAYIGYALLCQLNHVSLDQPNNLTDEAKFDYEDPIDPDDPEDEHLQAFLDFIEQSFHQKRIYQIPQPLLKSFNDQVKETLGTNWLNWAGPAPLYYDHDADSYFTVLNPLAPENFKASLNHELFFGSEFSTKAIDQALTELDA